MIIKEKKTRKNCLVIALIIIYVVRYTAIIKSRKINEISKTRIKTSFFLNQSFLACCTKIICVLLAYCMVTLWQVILYFDRFSRATFNVMKIGLQLGKQLLAKV